MPENLSQNLPSFPGTPLVDQQGFCTPIWHRFLLTMWKRTGSAQGVDGTTVAGTAADALDVASNALVLASLGPESAPGAMPLPLSDTPPAPDASIALLGLTGAPVANGPPPVITVTLDASPAVYPAPVSGSLLIVGGTVSLIELTRDGTYLTTGLTAGFVPLARGDRARVTYTVAPTGQYFIPG